MQGSPLSPRLFNFVIDCVIKQCNRLKKMASRHELSMFADDMVLEVDGADSTSKTLAVLCMLKSYNLTLNLKKTKVLTVDVEIARAAEKSGIEIV